MICKAKFPYGGNPCHYPAKYLVIAPVAPKVVCGYHARQFVKGALIPLKYISPNINIDQIPDINGFLDSLKAMGAQVSIVDFNGVGNRSLSSNFAVNISIKLGGEVHGKRGEM